MIAYIFPFLTILILLLDLISRFYGVSYTENFLKKISIILSILLATIFSLYSFSDTANYRDFFYYDTFNLCGYGVFIGCKPDYINYESGFLALMSLFSFLEVPFICFRWLIFLFIIYTKFLFFSHFPKIYFIAIAVYSSFFLYPELNWLRHGLASSFIVLILLLLTRKKILIAFVAFIISSSFHVASLSFIPVALVSRYKDYIYRHLVFISFFCLVFIIFSLTDKNIFQDIFSYAVESIGSDRLVERFALYNHPTLTTAGIEKNLFSGSNFFFSSVILFFVFLRKSTDLKYFYYYNHYVVISSMVAVSYLLFFNSFAIFSDRLFRLYSGPISIFTALILLRSLFYVPNTIRALGFIALYIFLVYISFIYLKPTYISFISN